MRSCSICISNGLLRGTTAPTRTSSSNAYHHRVPFYLALHCASARWSSSSSDNNNNNSTEKKRMSLTIRSHRQRAAHGTNSSNSDSAPSPSSAAAAAANGNTTTNTNTSTNTITSGHSTPTSSSASPDRAHVKMTIGSGNRQPVLHSLSQFTEPVKRIILIRNGRSQANEDVNTYVTTPDWRIPLVEEGKRECVRAGHQLAALIGDDPVYFYYSPYIRSRQSLRYVLEGYDEGRQRQVPHSDWWAAADDHQHPSLTAASSSQHNQQHGSSSSSTQPERATGTAAASSSSSSSVSLTPSAAASTTSSNSGPPHSRGGGPSSPPTVITPEKLSDASLILRHGSSSRIIGVREDVRLRDGDIGRYRTTAELLFHLEERERYGKFFYRFPHGESGADVCDRVTSFLDAFQRERVEFPMDTNVVIITHGLTMRMFIKRWFHLTVDTFHRMSSPPSGAICTLTRLHHKSCFRLDESCMEQMALPLSLNEHNGYKYRNKQLLGSMSSGAPYM